MMANKTLICIIAETRASKLSWPSIKRFVIDELRADLLLCISVPSNYDFGNPLWQFAKYRSSIPEFSDWGQAFDEAQILENQAESNLCPNWRQLLDIKDQWLGGVKGQGQHTGSAGILIYFRWVLLQFLKEENLLKRYDRFVITRSDFIWEAPHPPMELLNPQYIWFPDGEGYNGLTDRHVVLSKHNVYQYLNIIGPILAEPERIFSEMKHKKDWNLEQFIQFSLARQQLIDNVKYFPYIMYSAREWGGTTSWSKGLWSDDLGYYIKYKTEYHSAMAAKRVIARSQDWNSIFSEGSDVAFNSQVMSNNQNPILLIGKHFKQMLPEENTVSANTILSIDYSGMLGYLFAGQTNYGKYNRKYIEQVEVVHNEEGSIAIKNLTNNLYYALNESGSLHNDSNTPYHFTLRSRFF